jgi:amino acid transporter
MDSISPATAITPNSPKRVMGFRDLFLFYVVTGISLRWIAVAAAAGPSSIVVWFGAWLVFYVPLALSVIELSSRYPDEGGLYVWTKRAFGEFPAFLCGWMYWTSNFPYLPAALYFAAGNALYIKRDAWAHLAQSPAYYVIFSLLALGIVTALNVAGLGVGRWLHDLGALAVWIPAGIIISMGFIAWHRFGAANSFHVHSLTPSMHFKDIGFWAILIFAFAGAETASFMGAEIKGSRRTLPIALLTAGLTIALCYVLGTVGVLLALPAVEVSNLQGLMQSVARTASRVDMDTLVPVTAFFIALGTVAAVSAFLAATARLPFVAGTDQILPPVFGKLHPRWRTPWAALIIQAVVGAVFIFLGQAKTSVKGAYDVLVNIGIITYFIPYMFLFASVLKLQREPEGKQVVRILGNRSTRWLAILGLLTAIFAVVVSVVPDADEPNKLLEVGKVVGSTAIVLAVGTWIYWAGKRWARRLP